MVRVKICGITDVRDARAAARVGADALGFNFSRESPRYIRPERAKAIIAALPPLLTVVGVFVNEHPDTIMEICRLAGLDAAPLHGDESPSVVDTVRGVRRIKAIRDYFTNADWYRKRAVFGSSGYPCASPFYKGNPLKACPLPNIYATDACHFVLGIHEQCGRREVTDVLAAFRKVENAYAI